MSDDLAALKSVVLMQERIDGLRGDLTGLAGDLRALTEKVHTLDNRVALMEGMFEIGMRRGDRPRIEG